MYVLNGLLRRRGFMKHGWQPQKKQEFLFIMHDNLSTTGPTARWSRKLCSRYLWMFPRQDETTWPLVLLRI